MVENRRRRVYRRAVHKRTLHIVLHLNDHTASVLQAAVNVETGVSHLAHGDGDVARQIFQTLDVIVGEEPVQEFEKDVLVLLAAEQILEAPVRSRVNETLVLVIDEIAVLACHS